MVAEESGRNVHMVNPAPVQALLAHFQERAGMVPEDEALLPNETCCLALFASFCHVCIVRHYTGQTCMR